METPVLPNAKQTTLTKYQKQVIGLLSIGTFLEFFDLMLYVHLTGLLNDLFFPPSNPHVTKLLVAFTFCSTYIFRIFGAIIFGWIGDQMGRKYTVIVTLMIMASACFFMAVSPTYTQIGFTASLVMITCRILQGISSVGEKVGAELYLTETIRRPMQYVAVTLMSCMYALGGFAALGIATLLTSVYNFSWGWRLAFGFGLVIASVGSVARRTLRETPEFADAKKNLQNMRESVGMTGKEWLDNPMVKAKVKPANAFWYFITNCTQPVAFYIIFFYCSDLLKQNFGYTSTQVISNNFIVSIFYACHAIVVCYLGYYIYPLKIMKVTQSLFVFSTLCLPMIIPSIKTPGGIFWLQVFLVIFKANSLPGDSIFFTYFPVFKRFRYSSILWAMSKAIMNIVTSFGLIYLTHYTGHYGIWFITLPISVLMFYSLRHYEMLERKSGRHPDSQKAGMDIDPLYCG